MPGVPQSELSASSTVRLFTYSMLTPGWLAGSCTLDASVLVMPLVFFMAPTDPKFLSTLDAILQSVSKGRVPSGVDDVFADGLMSNNLVFRYNVDTTEGVPFVTKAQAHASLRRSGCH